MAEAVVGLVMTGVVPPPAAIVTVNVTAGLVPEALVAVSESGKVPAAFGVPESNPVVVLKVNPPGKAPVSAKLVGVLVAVV